MPYKGIDISDHNRLVDFDKVKADGIEFVMIRMGFGSDNPKQDDKQFERNVAEAERVGLPWGAYLYSYALNLDAAKSEVQHALRLLKGKKPSLPVCFDMEDADHYKEKHGVKPIENKQLLSDICYLWLSEMQNAGYDVRLYASKSWLEDILIDKRLDEFTKWVAQWNDKCTYDGKYDIWQYANNGKVNGIDGRVDMNYYYGELDQIEQLSYEKPKDKPQPKPKPKEKEDVLLLKKGDRGTKVGEIQKKLKELGYYKGNIDNIFGNLTDQAVRAFQKDEHIAVDGIVGKVTMSHLEKAKSKSKKKTIRYSVRPGDTLSHIAAMFDTTVQAIAKENNIKNVNLIRVGQLLTIHSGEKAHHENKPKYGTYVIKSGDTFWDIESKLHIPHGELQKINPDVNPKALQPGQKIHIPN